MTDRSRVIVVGLDGASWDVLDPLMARGLMPNLSDLASSGARDRLMSTYPGWTPPGWTSITTGLNPGHHGILYATRAVEGAYPDSIPGGVQGPAITGADVHGAPMWRVLSAAGRRVCVLLVPLTYPPEAVNGTLVSGMFRPREATDYAYPPETLGPDRWRFDPEMVLRGGDARHDDPAEVARSLREICEENARGFSDHLHREPWDLFFGVFMAPDRVGHYFWERMVRLGASGPADEIDRDIEAIWRTIDGFLGQAAAERDRGATVVIVSDHGSGPAPRERVNVLRAMEEAGLLRVKRTGWRRQPVLPPRFDWARTAAFPIFMGDLYIVGVAVNERGRWPNGSVDPKDADGVADRAERALRALRDAGGRPVVTTVHRAADVYRGPFAARFPDLLVEFDPRYMAGGRSPVGPRFVPHRGDDTEWGSHRQEGILVLSGPGVRGGGFERMPHVEDVAPTALRLLGLSFADPVDGRVLEEVLEPREVAAAPAVPAALDASRREPASPEEEAEIEGMLRGLGYIE
ncbi:MAG: alkaline phosphatase family protein [Actinomycetota bacterium]